MNRDEIEQAALQMPFKTRADLARKLLESLEQPSEAELEEVWLEEVGNRIKRVELGHSKLTPFALALQKARVIARNN